VDQGASVSTRDYRVRQLVDVRTRYDPPTLPRSNGLVLGKRHLDGRQAAFDPAFADEHDSCVQPQERDAEEARTDGGLNKCSFGGVCGDRPPRSLRPEPAS
jgi:hypothetical protein